MKPKVLVMSGYGINCEEETAYAFSVSGAQADIVHINDLINGKRTLSDYQMLAFPGGFAYGDDTGSGNAYANKLRNHLWDDIVSFVERDTLVLGICNGFQILVHLGLLPALDKKWGERQIALVHNDSARYTVRWVDIEFNTKSPFTKGVDVLSLPIAHGEGKLYATKQMLAQLAREGMIAGRYVKGEICDYLEVSANPNGSIHDIGAVTNETGRIFGLMPHPERAIFFHQLPNASFKMESYSREGREVPTEGPGLQLFKNAVEYFQ